MIALLTGQIAYRSADHIILDVGGVGYRLQIPLSTFYALPDEGQVQLKVHTHVKEDAIHLFGFLSESEKNFFALLISVSGVGPKLAITVLSHIPAEELGQALVSGDIARLTAIPGIGKKSAERLILELQDKAAGLTLDLPASNSQSTAIPGSSTHQDAISALVNLGYKENLAKKALSAVEIQPQTPLEDILKGALKILVK